MTQQAQTKKADVANSYTPDELAERLTCIGHPEDKRRAMIAQATDEIRDAMQDAVDAALADLLTAARTEQYARHGEAECDAGEDHAVCAAIARTEGRD